MDKDYISHDGRCVLWRRVTPTIVNATDYETEFERVSKEYHESNAFLLQTRASNIFKFLGDYTVIDTPSYRELRYIDKDSTPHVIELSLNGDLAENHGAGIDAYEFVQDKIRELSGDDITIRSIFSGKQYKDVYNKVKKCVLSPFDYADPLFTKSQIKVSKADVSSAYPTELCKTLPTFHDCKVVEGRKQPDPDYPFAFYVKSHQLAILGEFDTFSFASTLYPYSHQIGRKWNPHNMKPEDDETVLCKAETKYAPYIKKTFQEMYDKRKDSPDMKLYMNAFIGFLQLNSDPFASCVSAVVIARCAHNMIERCNKLIKAGNTPVLVNTDSISWIGGHPVEGCYETGEKKMGKFMLEYTDIPMIIESVKAYQFMTPDGKVETRYAGVDKQDTKDWKFGDILSKEVGGAKLVQMMDDGSIKEVKL